MLICGMINGRVKIWDLPSSSSTEEEEDVSLGKEPSSILEGHRKSVFAMSAKDDILVTASGGLDKSVRVWDLVRREQTHVVLYENALNCQKLEIGKGFVAMWYISEAVINRAFISRGELVMWRFGDAKEMSDLSLADNAKVMSDVSLADNAMKMSDLSLADNAVFAKPSERGERVKFGDVSDQFSVVGYPTQVIVYENSVDGFVRLRSRRLEDNTWLYLLKVFRGLLLTVAREGAVETVHGLLDDEIVVSEARTGDVLYCLEWKWTLFSPLKSVLMTPFGLVGTNTSERAFLWHWEDLPGNFLDTRVYLEVSPSRQSSFVVQWRNKPSTAMNVRGVALVNEQRRDVYLMKY